MNITNLEDFIRESYPTQILKDFKVQRLTKPGDNYGGLLLLFDLVLQDKLSNAEEKKTIIGKGLLPNVYLRKVQNTGGAFWKEYNFYKTIIPTLNEFLHENNLQNFEIFPTFINGRFSLVNQENITDDALLLIENLKPYGYDVGKRLVGFDLETSCIILKNLAIFQGTAVALKCRNRNKFEMIRRLLKKVSFEDNTFKAEQIKKKVLNYINFIMATDDSIKVFTERLNEAYNYYIERNDVREPFATIVHNDFWVNNILIKSENDAVVGVKFIDFQNYIYGSPAKDLLFFLFTSVQNSVIASHFNELIAFYFRIFLETAKKLSCDCRELTLENFIEEINIEAKCELYHILLMLPIIFDSEDGQKDIGELTVEDLVNPNGITENQTEKTLFVIGEFVKRNWV